MRGTMLEGVARRANAIARRYGHWVATGIEVAHCGREQPTDSGGGCYVKNSTGQRVPMAYVNKAWSSCHYEAAWCVVRLIDPRPAMAGCELNFVSET